MGAKKEEQKSEVTLLVKVEGWEEAFIPEKRCSMVDLHVL